MPDPMAPRPTVTRASLLVEYADGSAFYLTLPEAVACHVAHTPTGQVAEYHDGLDFAVPGGVAQPHWATPQPNKVLSIDFERCPEWRLVLREPGKPWPLNERFAG